MSLDMCADQYALALLPRAQILGLSPRAAHQDSFYRDRVRDIALRRPTLEALLALKPDAILRTWGGDAKLLQQAEKRGIKIIQINEVSTFAQAGFEVENVAAQLGVPQAGAGEAFRMKAALDRVPPPVKAHRVLYYTPSGFSAGPSTWVGQLVGATGHKLAASQDYFFYLSPEVFLKEKADVYALGFYDDAYAMRRSPGRHPLVRARLDKAKPVTIPSPMLACSAWYAAFGLPELAEKLS
ncbi:ABC transporter substrate-binding protein [Asticcacaulis sp. AND118]|uniref:ABC transporter substrate-binding protein n=1 Tax=Asticcacaulis sp. AND118 TaxID=2840468 RepID=UPI001CFFA96C|nr:ABC transporter substrate-binding protein [Asticcacaulis sp. AND118]UDF02451.1 iron ABC transporter substrate-binding protein [Asticcacaulis sp. AND118]